MRQRCENRRHTHFDHYGGAGVKVCERWRGKGGFERFLADMGPRPSKLFTLDRIDRERGYEPGNCRWAKSREQNRNHGNVLDAKKYLGPDGTRRTISEWAEHLRVKPDTLRWRVRQKKGVEAFRARERKRPARRRAPARPEPVRLAA